MFLGGIAIPFFTSPRTIKVSPGLISKTSLASFGMTNCPFSPTFTVQANFPSGFFIYFPPTYHLYDKYDLYNLIVVLKAHRVNKYGDGN